MTETCVNRRPRIGRIISWVFAGIAIAIVVAILFGYLVQFLWAKTLVPLFGFPEISYWQAVGIVILAKLLFGGLGGHDHSGHKDKESEWENKFERKCADYFTRKVPEYGPEHERFQAYWEKEGEAAFKEFLQTQNSGSEKKESAENLGDPEKKE